MAFSFVSILSTDKCYHKKLQWLIDFAISKQAIFNVLIAKTYESYDPGKHVIIKRLVRITCSTVHAIF